jgi:hypothetical protein
MVSRREKVAVDGTKISSRYEGVPEHGSRYSLFLPMPANAHARAGMKDKMNIDMDTNDDSNGNGNKNDDIDTLKLLATTTTRRGGQFCPTRVASNPPV